ncbi:MAG: STAS domain-containing protein [Sideroxyarcus sp.]|nr:STAS domain-containing protein [Sideroxyarcus sp.]
MIRFDNDRMLISGNLTIETVGEIAATPLCDQQTVRVIDLGQVEKVDSSAVALLLHWLRQVGQTQCRLSFVNVPKDLHSLAALYDVADILSLTATGKSSD